MALLCYLPKLKRYLGLAFGAHFMYNFSIEMFLIKYFINKQSFNVIPFFLSQDIKQTVLLSSYLHSLVYLVLHFSYDVLMTFPMMLSVILISMLVILPSTLNVI